MNQEPRRASREPADPFGQLAQAAITMHSLFVAYREAGFTDDQALRLVAYVATASNSPGPTPDDPA